MDSFFNKGEMYFDTVESFRKKDENNERYDLHESSIDIEQVSWIKVQAENGQIFEFSKTLPDTMHFAAAYKLSYDYSMKGNIYSCTAITKDTLEQFKSLDPRFRFFGDTLILIENPNKFFDRIENELKRQNYDFESALVNYYNPKEKTGMLSVFDKKDIHAYQNEIRIWVRNDDGNPIKIFIGSIKDIASRFKICALMNLEKYEA